MDASSNSPVLLQQVKFLLATFDCMFHRRFCIARRRPRVSHFRKSRNGPIKLFGLNTPNEQEHGKIAATERQINITITCRRFVIGCQSL